MVFDEKLKIFQYHFPAMPILPGALLMDVVLNDLLAASDFTFSARFLNPIRPNANVEFAIEQQGPAVAVRAFDERCTYAKMKLETTAANPFIPPANDDYSIAHERIGGFKPRSNGSREITFLDQWYFLNCDEGMTAAGVYHYRPDTLACVADLGQIVRLGQDFFLIEFMSLTVLSSLAKEKRIDLQDYYGFARINHYQRYHPVKAGDRLTAVVHKSLTGTGIIWDGVVLRDGCLIANIGQGVDLPLIKKG